MPHPAAVAVALVPALALGISHPAAAESTPAAQAASAAGTTGETRALVAELQSEPPVSDDAEPWYRRVNFAGLIEVEASYLDPFAGEAASDLRLATVELGLEAQVNDWVKAFVSTLYEQDATDLEIDSAEITLANAAVTPVFITAGQSYLPFGGYATNLVSDPLTLDLGENRATAVQLGLVQGDFFGTVYAFGTDHAIDGRDQLGSWGALLGFAQESERNAWGLAAGYIDDLGDSDTLAATIAGNQQSARDDAIAAGADPTSLREGPTRRTGGWTVQANASLGPIDLIGEYLAATGSFETDSLAFRDRGARPAAWNLEAGYRFALFGRDSNLSVAWQGTREALALELPETRWLLGWSIALFKQTTFALEWSRDQDYGASAGGTGQRANAVVAQLAVEF